MNLHIGRIIEIQKNNRREKKLEAKQRERRNGRFQQMPY